MRSATVDSPAPSVRYAHATVSATAEITAESIVATLATLPPASRIAAPAPIIQAVVIAGIEVAVGPSSDEAATRRLWRERHGRGAQPLLLLTDDPARPGSVVALGLVDGGGPMRSLDAAALGAVLRRVSSYQRLDAVRELAAELERLDQAGVPGLKLRGLLTAHTLARLKADGSRWDDARRSSEGVRRPATWQDVLTALGYQLDRRPVRGYVVRRGGHRVAVVHPRADPAEFARLDAEGRPAEGALLNDCTAEAVPFGILASGGRMRLFEADPELGSAAARYLELDANTLPDDDRPFLALLSPAYLVDGGFQNLQREARAFGGELRRRLDETIRQSVLPVIAQAFTGWASANGLDIAQDQVREEFERASLTLVFRALFLLYAEAAGYLPMDKPIYRRYSLTCLVEEADETQASMSPASSSLWDRFSLLVKAMRSGNTAWSVPPYNGDLFAADGFDGAATLEKLALADPQFGAVLIGLGRDPTTRSGVDYSTLDIGHLGHIYEGLLSLKLSVADATFCYDSRADAYRPPAEDESADVNRGELMWQTQQGGRKGGGVYYTRSELVRHLVRQAVIPGFAEHLDRVRDIAVNDPAAAAAQLLDFTVLDPACGSAHFLVVATTEMADQVVRFLAGTPLPAIRIELDQLRAGATTGATVDDVALLRRLVLKKCIFGVDISPMGAEVAKLSLWLASFVPGLSLAYLGRNVIVGNSLIGVARTASVTHAGAADARPGRSGHRSKPEGNGGNRKRSDDHSMSWLDAPLQAALESASAAAREAAASDDRNLDAVARSLAADKVARAATRRLADVFDLWTAAPLGLEGARRVVELYGADILGGRSGDMMIRANDLAGTHRFLHWPVAFPQIFGRERPGFDAVIGNPPWEEVTVEELGFLALHLPGLRGMNEADRADAILDLETARPWLRVRLDALKEVAAQQRWVLAAESNAASAGDPDLYKFFCKRYQVLLRPGGRLGVVLPRSAFAADGSSGFRAWLFGDMTCERVDFLLNRSSWAFDAEPRYTIALVVGVGRPPEPGHRLRIAGPAASVEEWNRQVAEDALSVTPEALGPGQTVPLLPSQAAADLLAKVRRGSPFARGASGRWRCFPVGELHETNDRPLWAGATEGHPLWKGESFDQYAPNGAEARWCPESPRLRRKIEKPRPGAGSVLAPDTPLEARRRAVIDEIPRARVAFRDVTNRTNSRTVIACVIPPDVLLTNTGPYLVFVQGDDRCRAACVGILNSLAFDWQARRFAEIHLSFFILEGLIVPDLDDDSFGAIAHAAARLSCVDDRYIGFAAATGVECGPLDDQSRRNLRVEIDARVAHAWQLTVADLDVIFADFTRDAVPVAYREALISRLTDLVGAPHPVNA